MYLKHLDMKGFKSFANRTGFTFVPGITAIVGPNGSGKSNVTDGIRWVLGEQSAKSLRGAKMEDVIFAGSSTRKPVGYCEVSITFDNSEQRLAYDYAEVTVTRRVYRSGESEYYLNKQLCRLKDINELFMDTGIGKEAYSVIGQGKIDDILSTKSEDRRAIFEEAAGIVKYKSRKKEAQRKLEATEQNLARIHDLIHELETQIEPLTEQSEVARQYKEWKNELREQEIGLYVYKIKQLHQSWEKTKMEVDTLADQQMGSAAQLSTKESLLAELKHQLHQTEQAWEEWQAKLLTAGEGVEKAEASQRVLAERIASQEQTQQHVEGQAKQIEWDLDEIKEEREQLQEELQSKRENWSVAEERLVALLEQLEQATGAESNVHVQLEQELLQLDNRQLTIATEQRHLHNQQEALRQKHQQQTEEQAEWQRKLIHTDEERTELRQRMAVLQSEQIRINEQCESITAQLHDLETTEQGLRQQGEQQQRLLTQLQSRYDSLQEIQESHEGFFYGVREILRARDQGDATLQRVEGAVAELMEVDHQYEHAIEVALGGALQHIVVADEETGRTCIHYLKKHKLGRATFLPLDVLKGRSVPAADLTSVCNHPAFVGVAAELVEVQPRYQVIMQNLLGTIIVANSLAGAQEMARLLRYRYRIVTVAGDVVNPGGSMAGGSRPKNRSSILGRSRQLTELGTELSTRQVEQSSWEERYYDCEQAIIEARQRLKHSRGEQEQVNQEHRDCQGKEREWAIQSEYLQSRLTELDKQFQHLQEQQVSLQAQQTALQQESEQGKTKIAALQEKMDVIKLEQAEKASTKEAIQAQIVDEKIQVAEYRQELEYLQQRKERLDSGWQRLLEQKRAIEEQKNEIKLQLELLIAEHLQSEQEYSQANKQKQDVLKRVQGLKVEREEAQSEREQQERTVRELERQLKRSQEEHHQKEVRANRLDVELNHCLQKLAEEYELSYERAVEEYAVPEEPSKVERGVRSLKQRINTLGEVNLGAIDEFERLQERLQFLQTQEEDLLQAKQRLYQMISQIEEEMGKRFEASFALIRNEFQEVFVQMFGGGQADLRLTDPENLLETGIEIVAQPPGKRLQNLSLLSGGERALAAIALLFAVLRIKPVPFCVLDEVDAALDEVNLSRFTHYMQEFSHNTQFIIITHRKRTMEGADVLYGITMQESGVSSLVSVQMEAMINSKKEVATVRE